MGDTVSIQEFSQLTGIDPSTLRFWDGIGLFSPLSRNPENNYRHYSKAQLLALNFVTSLSALDVPLKTIAELRDERNPEGFLELLQNLEKDMDMEMRDLRQRYSIVHARRELISMGLKVEETEITVLPLEDMSMILWPRNEYKEGDTFLDPLSAHLAHTGEHHINLSFPVAGRHDNMESFKKAPGCPDNFLSIDPIGIYTRAAGNYLVGFARGYYGEVGDLPDRMTAYARENHFLITGPVYTMYLHDEICTKDPSQYLAKCSVQVEQKRR
jgi:DNA-binding transcriptional MerR regulator